MQSCLEKRGIEEREIEIVRSDYNANDPYSANHKDAQSDGDIHGKGTNHGGHSHWLPNCNEPKGKINYSNFDTVNGGGSADVEARRVSMVRSMYNADYQYGANLVNTEENLNKGQFQMK
jgi:hypothetical protein